MSGQRQLRDQIRDAIQGQVAYVLVDPGPHLSDMEYAAERIADMAVSALMEHDPADPHAGWLLWQGEACRLERVNWQSGDTDGGYALLITTQPGRA